MNLVIPEPRLIESAPGKWRVEAEIAGQTIFFESSVPLSPRIEAFVCPMLFPAMSRGLNLEIQAPLESAMMDNLLEIQGIAQRWWSGLGSIEICAQTTPGWKRSKKKGLFFTGGVDSSFALFRLKDEVNELLFVEGYDVKLSDEPRLQRARESLQKVADATGHRLVFIRTNLRNHHLFDSLPWDIMHIAALAAVAHTLGERLGTFYVADSDVPPPHGSNPGLDGLWSSGSVGMASFGAGYSRLQRVAAIREWLPLRGRLRVCWENLAETLNCGHCRKCLLTRLQLLAAGDPAGMDSFPLVPLKEALERMAKNGPGISFPNFWRETRAALDDPALCDLIDILLAQNSPPTPLTPPSPAKPAPGFLKRLFGIIRPARH